MRISNDCPESIIFQTLESGYYDYSNEETLEDAWQAEKLLAWVKDAVAEGQSMEDVKAEFLATLTEATPEEALEAALGGYGWPIALGYVEEKETGYKVLELINNQTFRNKTEDWGTFDTLPKAQAKAEDLFMSRNPDASNEELDSMKAANEWRDDAAGIVLQVVDLSAEDA